LASPSQPKFIRAGGARPNQHAREANHSVGATQERVPATATEIHVDTRQRIIDHGYIITAGGFIAWVDIGARAG